MPRRPDQSEGRRREQSNNPATPAPSQSSDMDTSILAPELQSSLRRLNGSYDPMYCIAVLALMSQGASIAEVSLRLRVPFSKLKRWREEHDDFKQAFDDGGAYALGWWEAMGRTNITDKNFNATLWLMQMVNRFGYVRGDTGLPGQNGNNTPSQQITFTSDTHNHLHCDLSRLSKMELESMANTLRKARGGSEALNGRPSSKAIAVKSSAKKEEK